VISPVDRGGGVIGSIQTVGTAVEAEERIKASLITVKKFHENSKKRPSGKKEERIS